MFPALVNDKKLLILKVWLERPDSCTIPYNTSSLRHILLLSLHHERRTVNVPGEQDKGVCHL